MDSVHMILGTVVLVAYLALTVVNVMQLDGTRTIEFARPLSMAAASLLLVQLVIGFNLLAGDRSITVVHYLFALATLATVAAEHGLANSREGAVERARVTAFATAGTTLLVLIAYLIGETSG